MKEACITHGYDGWAISINERPVWALVGEHIYEWFWFSVLRDPCCKWKLPEWDWLQSFMYDVGCALPTRLFWPKSKNGLRHSHWNYPVHGEWVAEHFPGLTREDDEDDEPKDPDHGVKCPVCGFGRVNDSPEKSIKEHGKCFRCVVAEKIASE
jgi:hypothetical protein